MNNKTSLALLGLGSPLARLDKRKSKLAYDLRGLVSGLNSLAPLALAASSIKRDEEPARPPGGGGVREKALSLLRHDVGSLVEL